MSQPRWDIPNDFLVKTVLEFLGNKQPSRLQQQLVERLLSTATINVNCLLNQRLSPQEQAVLRLAAAGQTAAETAQVLQLSEKTVKLHREHLRQKLGCKTLPQAVMQGMRYGYLMP